MPNRTTKIKRVTVRAGKNFLATQKAVRVRKDDLGYVSRRNDRLDSKRTFKVDKKGYQEAKKNFHDVLNASSSSSLDIALAKNNLVHAKRRKIVSKKIKKTAVKLDGGTVKSRTAKSLKRSAHMKARSLLETGFKEDETLSDAVKARQAFRKFDYTKYRLNVNARRARKVGSFSGRLAYSLSTRTLNLVNGRGFVRTPDEYSKAKQLANRLRLSKMRLKKSKTGRAIGYTSKFMRFLLSPAMKFFANPLSVFGIVGGLVFLFMISVVMSIFSLTTTYQSEFDLSDSWKLMTLYDRERSDDKVDYWTNLDDVTLFLNEKNEDYSLWDKTYYKVNHDDLLTKTGRYSDYMSVLWDKLNDDTNDIKTMKDVYSNKKNLDNFAFDSDELDEFNEKLENISEEGTYPDLLELDNPLYSQSDVKFDNPLEIVKRYGADTKDSFFNGMTIQANVGQTVLASLDGTVELDRNGTTVRIFKDKDTYLSYVNINGIRVKNGQKIASGDIIGTLSKQNLTIYYRKVRDKEDDKKPAFLVNSTLKKLNTDAGWSYVNPGFYFSKVHYLQTTSVMSDLSGDIATKARQLKPIILKYFPQATDKGIAGALGNWAVESNINPKRAEGDYLSPPIGASASSWDDLTWLSMSGPQIYDGRFPNILHRGLGLGQWTDTSDGAVRHTALLNFANSKNKKWYDLELQIDFMFNGDSPGYQTIAKSILSSSDSPSTLAQRFLINWEGNPGDKLKERQNASEQVYKALTTSSATSGSTDTIPQGYEDKVSPKPTDQVALGNSYPFGQCTWGAYNRLAELGKNKVSSFEGNGGFWWQTAQNRGLPVHRGNPKAHEAISFPPGAVGSDKTYGHVGVVEVVNPDGSILVSETNAGGGLNGKRTWRIISATDVLQCYYIDYS